MKIAVLISGRGSNLQALIDAAGQARYPAEIVLVISNVAGVRGLARAAEAGIAATVIDHRQFDEREAFEDALHESLTGAGADLVCLAGFMRLLTAGFVGRWRDRLINIHPSLLPSFRGLDTHRRAIDAGVRFAGCTVHYVRAEIDDGPIILQALVPVHAGDSADDLAARVLAREHEAYPLAVKLIADGRVTIEGGRVSIDGAKAPDGVMINPEG